MGVLPRNENQLNEMILIMESMHKYCPNVQNSFMEDEDDPTSKLDVDCYHHVLFGGDQLTVARARGAQGQRENSNSGEKRLEVLCSGCRGLAHSDESPYCKSSTVCLFMHQT